MKIKKLISIIMVLGIIATGCGRINKEAIGKLEEKATPIKIEKTSRGRISNSFSYGGKINPKQQIHVISKMPGKVKELHFDVGDEVKTGDILFRLDEKDIENNIKLLEAQLKSADAAVSLGKVGLDSAKGSQQEQQKIQLEAAVKNSEIQFNDAKKAYEDMKTLYDLGSISQQQLDQTKSAYEAASLGYNSAKDSYHLFINSLSKESVKAAQSQLSQATAARESVQVQIDSAKETLKDATVKSPIDGIVSSRTVEAGEMVGSSIPPFTIIQMDIVSVDVNVSEQIINKLKKDQKVEVYVSSASKTPFEGKIKVISPAADERTFTYPVKIEIPNQSGLLKPGMFAEIEFNVDTVNDAIIVPRETILTEGDISYIYTVEGDRAKRIEVKIGLDNGRETEIIEGLEEGTQIVIKGQNYLEDGGKVQIIED
ncbi:MAG: efflux RND transporter periplasmic adaptor subunit [Epulopiscium sp.]|nr:efflux RND transporter periplasmic adaptor subunit [Candidatus Epulonipiscium sp.]